ncbi:hypothetical protein AB6A40_007869 [Gnathostoma spinigerum]|uniref:SLIT-ROBO Rho GTPase activating protein n=1 Tax=Gnathostoma spinigerum TaxID=75299 RepID=A0ABD6ENR0_9BILA
MASATASAPNVEVRTHTAAKAKTNSHDFELHVKEIRVQLNEQMRCLELRTETQTSILTELSDFFRRRAELDAEYGRQLEKLAKTIMQKHKNEKNRRDSWILHSTCSLWQQLVDDTKEEARQKLILSDIYGSHLVSRIAQRSDDLCRMSRKCREIGALAHGEIGRVLNELQTAMKTYQYCFSEFGIVETKFRQAELGKLKYEEANPTKLGTTRKHRSLARHYDKRSEKFEMVKLKCLKARNEYILCVQAANAALHKYFAEDLSDLIDCMDLGFEHWMCKLVSNVVSARKAICQTEMDALAELCAFKQGIDAKADKQRFFEANYATFMLPKRFEFRSLAGDNDSMLSATDGIAEELQQRQMQIERRLANVRLESEEIWKTLESTEMAVRQKYTEGMAYKGAEMIRQNGSDPRKDSKSDTQSVDSLKNKSDLIDLYDYYLTKFSHYLLNGNLIERLEARSSGIGSALNTIPCCKGNEKTSKENTGSVTPASVLTAEGDEEEGCTTNRTAHRKKRIGGGSASEGMRNPRLFGGSLDEYCEATGEAIPVILTSCIRVLSQFALHHQGIFRISGSQLEINAFKEAFERGDDPLVDVVDASDVNSVAGVLKLYLRELREPLFPIFLFDQLTECAKCSDHDDFIAGIKPLLEKLSQPTLLVLRYLFAFLNHLSEFSDENMMDPYNLAICFGPTLLPIPEGKDQVFYHNFVNELVKNLILYYEEVFPSNLPGPMYHKYNMEAENCLFMDDPDGFGSGDDEKASVSALAAGGSASINDASSTVSSASGYISLCRSVPFSYLSGPLNCQPSCSDCQNRHIHIPTGASSGCSPVPRSTSDSPQDLSVPFTSSNNIQRQKPANHWAHCAPPVAPSVAPSTRTRVGCDSAFLIKRYGDDFSSSSHDSSVHSPVIDTVSSQVWTRRIVGASSLREQLHHSRKNEEDACVTTSSSPPPLLRSQSVHESEKPNVDKNSNVQKSVMSSEHYATTKETSFCGSLISHFTKPDATLSFEQVDKANVVEPDLVRSLPHDAPKDAVPDSPAPVFDSSPPLSASK